MSNCPPAKPVPNFLPSKATNALATEAVELTVSGKTATGKRYVHKMVCAADKEQAFRLKVGSTYSFTNAAAAAISMEITSIRRSRKTDFF